MKRLAIFLAVLALSSCTPDDARRAYMRQNVPLHSFDYAVSDLWFLVEHYRIFERDMSASQRESWQSEIEFKSYQVLLTFMVERQGHHSTPAYLCDIYVSSDDIPMPDEERRTAFENTLMTPYAILVDIDRDAASDDCRSRHPTLRQGIVEIRARRTRTDRIQD